MTDVPADVYARLAALEANVQHLARHLGLPDPPPPPGLPAVGADPLVEVRGLKAEGRTINAIKRYRELTGVGLAEAKDAVDRM